MNHCSILTMQKLTIKIRKKPKRMGHIAHRSGSGIHQDRRTKRQRTRAAIRQKILTDAVS